MSAMREISPRLIGPRWLIGGVPRCHRTSATAAGVVV